jgi:hypothetical protein
MITDKIIAEQVLDRLKKFTTDSDITLNDSILAVQQCLADFALQRATASGIPFDGVLYHIFENIPVVEGVVLLPATPMANEEAISISKGMMDKPYTQMAHGANSFKNLPAFSLGGEIGYFLNGDKVYFAENNFGLEPPSTVVVKMLCPVTDPNSDVRLVIPADMQQGIIDMVFKRLGITDQIPADETKDDIDAKS